MAYIDPTTGRLTQSYTDDYLTGIKSTPEADTPSTGIGTPANAWSDVYNATPKEPAASQPNITTDYTGYQQWKDPAVTPTPIQSSPGSNWGSGISYTGTPLKPTIGTSVTQTRTPPPGGAPDFPTMGTPPKLSDYEGDPQKYMGIGMGPLRQALQMTLQSGESENPAVTAYNKAAALSTFGGLITEEQKVATQLAEAEKRGNYAEAMDLFGISTQFQMAKYNAAYQDYNSQFTTQTISKNIYSGDSTGGQSGGIRSLDMNPTQTRRYAPILPSYTS